MNEMMQLLSNKVNYFWIAVSLSLGVLSHVCRTLRWNILIENIEGRSNFKNAFLAVMIGYFANLALPRMGEFTRCGVLSKYENMSFSKLFGTVILERVIDLLMFLLILLFVVLTQMNVVTQFIKGNPEIMQAIHAVFGRWLVFPVLVGIALILFVCRKHIRSLSFYKKIRDVFAGIGEGFRSIKTLERKWEFLFHSVAIWVLYYLMLYVVFFAFDFTSELSPMVGLTVFAMSTIGMVLPVQGGIGTWHFMVIACLFIYLPDVENIDSLSRAFAFLAHGSMNLMIIAVGIISVIALPLLNRKKKIHE
jgi:uncharacterized protein (TIRG00374 family)